MQFPSTVQYIVTEGLLYNGAYYNRTHRNEVLVAYLHLIVKLEPVKKFTTSDNKYVKIIIDHIKLFTLWRHRKKSGRDF